MERVYLDPKMVPEHLRNGYKGKKFKAVVCDKVRVPNHAGLWNGGSRETYEAIELDTGRAVTVSDNFSAPWNKERMDREIELKPGLAVVMHSIFCGKDMGLTFYVHPENAAKLLPPPVAELTDKEKAVLEIIAAYKSAYREEYYQRAGLAHSVVESIKNSLECKGLIDKRGAITVAGRNARTR